MKPTIKPFVLMLFVALTCLSLALPVRAEFVLNVSSSSQINEAFGGEALKAFMKDSGVNVKLHVFSSETCIDRLKNGFSNLAGSTVPLSRADKNAGLVEIPVCKDPMAIIVHPSTKVKNLELKQVREIFSGHVRNWKELGGEDLPIVLVVPSKSTGANQNFRNMVMGPFDLKDDLVASAAFTAVIGVKYIPGSISFIAGSIAAQHKDVDVVSVDNRKPGDSGYPYHQTFYLVIKGEPEPMMKQVINYMLSDKAKQRMIQRGMTPIIE